MHLKTPLLAQWNYWKSRAKSISIISQKSRKNIKALFYIGIFEGRRFQRCILSLSEFSKLFKFELNTINITSISYTGIFSVDSLEHITPMRPFCSHCSSNVYCCSVQPQNFKLLQFACFGKHMAMYFLLPGSQPLFPLLDNSCLSRIYKYCHI